MRNLLLIAAAVPLFIGCSKSDVTEPTKVETPVISTQQKTLNGNLQLVNSGTYINTEGVKVVLSKGSSFIQSAITDKNGDFTIPVNNVDGDYTLSFEKAGYNVVSKSIKAGEFNSYLANKKSFKEDVYKIGGTNIAIESFSYEIVDSEWFQVNVKYKSLDGQGGYITLFTTNQIEKYTNINLFDQKTVPHPFPVDGKGEWKWKFNIKLNKESCGPEILFQAVAGDANQGYKDENGKFIFTDLDIKGNTPKFKVVLP